MKYTETGFRAVYHRFAVFPLTEVTRSAIEGFPGEKTAEGVLTYGYYDRHAGVTLEVLSCAKKGENGWRFADPQGLVRSFIRIEAVQDDDFTVLSNPDEKLYRKFAHKLEVLKGYEAEEAVEKSRMFDFLDDARHPEYIDDVQVFLEKKGLKPELCWARITDLGDHCIWAKLLNEPYQDFGLHEGEDFTFFVRQDEKTGKVTCHAQLSPLNTIEPESLADGKQLKDAIHRFHQNNDDTEALFRILQILRDSNVWIPCNAVVGEEDQKTVEQMIAEAGDDLDSLVGKTIRSSQSIRMIPDIFEKDGQFFFPAFSTEEDMGEYGENFSKLQQSFMDVIQTARNSEKYEQKITGIVINAFTEPFILPEELYEAVEKMVSRTEQGGKPE